LAPGLGMQEGQILIGHPSASIKDADGDAGKQYLNLFFYRVDHGAYPAHGRSNEPFYIRMHCLITALGSKEAAGANGNGMISAGENDLRLIGGVMALLHEHPFLSLHGEDGHEVASLQILLDSLGLDDVNHIWSTQGETPYRLSVAYELALAPVPLSQPARLSPLVGSIGTAVFANPMVEASSPVPRVSPTLSQAVKVDTTRTDWAPQIGFLNVSNGLEVALSFATDFVPASVRVMAAGLPGESVSLVWETWDRARGWTIADSAAQRIRLQSDRLDPTESRFAIEVTLPITGPGQALLYAVREWTRVDGSVVPLRSNPILVTVYAEDAA
ncbi:MAG: Pvc16 family protein, partial [Chromatiales bacterium]